MTTCTRCARCIPTDQPDYIGMVKGRCVRLCKACFKSAANPSTGGVSHGATQSPSNPGVRGLDIQLRRPNFLGDDGRLYLVRCFACDPEWGRENYGPAVATGTCAWCGWHDDREVA